MKYNFRITNRFSFRLASPNPSPPPSLFLPAPASMYEAQWCDKNGSIREWLCLLLHSHFQCIIIITLIWRLAQYNEWHIFEHCVKRLAIRPQLVLRMSAIEWKSEEDEVIPYTLTTTLYYQFSTRQLNNVQQYKSHSFATWMVSADWIVTKIATNFRGIGVHCHCE